MPRLPGSRCQLRVSACSSNAVLTLPSRPAIRPAVSSFSASSDSTVRDTSSFVMPRAIVRATIAARSAWKSRITASERSADARTGSTRPSGSVTASGAAGVAGRRYAGHAIRSK